MASLRIIIVDDNEIFRKGIEFYITSILKHYVIGFAENGDQFLNLPNVAEADVVLMDIEMPNLNGIEALKKYLWWNSEMKAIAVTSYEESVYLAELIGAGFRGCVLKKNIYNELSIALENVIQGKIFFPENIKISKD